MLRQSLLLFAYFALYLSCSISNCRADTAWQAVGPFGGMVNATVIEKSNSQVAYVATNTGIFKSTNGGASWVSISNGVTMSWDTEIHSLVIDPNDSQTLYAGTYSSAILKTTNGGISWTNVSSGMTSRNVFSLAIDPKNSQTVYAGTSGGVYTSIDGGISWVTANAGLTDLNCCALAVSPGNGTVLVGTGGGVFKSTNGGVSWTSVSPSAQVVVLAFDPTDGKTVYAGSYQGVYKSGDGGATWTTVSAGTNISMVFAFAISPSNGQDVYAATIDGVFKSANGGLSWSALNFGVPNTGFYSIAVDPSNGDTIFAGTGSGLFKSVDGGTLWTAVEYGITSLEITAIAIDRANAQTLYAGTNSGVFKSTNGGASWIVASTGLTSSDVSTLAIDPNNSRTLYAATYNGIFRTTDGGASWGSASSGITDHLTISSLVIDPSNSQVIYAGTYNGIFKTTNGGTTWSAINSGLTATYTRAIALDPTDSQTVYLGTQDNDGKRSTGFFKSTNGGLSWTAVYSGMGSSVISLAVDPVNNHTIYAGTFGSVLKSTDSGVSWTAFSPFEFSAINALAIDPNNSQTLYAGTYSGKTFTSKDGGVSWAVANNGVSNAPVNSLAIDPTNSQTIYVAAQSVFKSLISSTIPTITDSSPNFTVGTPSSCQIESSGWPAPQFSLSGPLPAGLSFAPLTGIISGTPVSGAQGAYPVIITASNGIPPDAVRGMTVTVLSASSLKSTIVAPLRGSSLATLSGISGTASGSGLSKIEVLVTDGSYYLQADRGFGLTAAWLPATGTTSWFLNTTGAVWREGITYTIQVRASGGNTYSVPVASTFAIQVPSGKTGTALSLALSPDTLRAGSSSTVSGKLLRADGAAAASQSITLILTPPATADVPNPALVTTAVSTDASGAFSSGTLAPFVTPGVYTVQARFEGTGALAACFASQALGVTPRSGYAIIVTGKATDNSLLDLHTATTGAVYNTLVNKRGFLPADITVLQSSADLAVTKQQLQDAITVWAKGKLTAAPAPLYLFMVDHGTGTGFLLGDQTVTPDDLAGWLDALESDPGVVASGALDLYRRFVVVGTCYSGAFVPKISKAGRVVISSAAADERSIAGFSIFNSASNTTFSGGEYFIDTMINFLGRGDSFKDAFSESSSMVGLRDPRGVAAGFHAGVYDTLAQHPLLDDNGDATGSYSLDGSPDGVQASALSLGVGVRSIGNPADITAVSPTDFLPAGGAGNYPLWLQVHDSSRVAKAWVEIRTPGSVVSGATLSGQVIPSLVTLPLYYDGSLWQGSYSFSASGTYNILYYTQDNQTGDISPAAHSVIYRKLSGNPTPAAFSLSSPADASGLAGMFPLSWQEVASPNPVSYTVLVSTDQNFGSVVYREDGIAQAATYIADGKLKNPATGANYCLISNDTWCYWKVRAIDSYGAVTESDTRSFTTVLTSGLPALLKGYVRDAVSGAPIAAASITAGASSLRSLSNGFYLLMAPPGTLSLTVSARGYAPKTLPGIVATAGGLSGANVTLQPAAKAGDCDGNGTVSLAELQGALNMYLGLKPVKICVDQDNNGSVSGSELQKVINAFMGL